MSEKLKALKQLLVLLITDSPEVDVGDKTVAGDEGRRDVGCLFALLAFWLRFASSSSAGGTLSIDFVFLEAEGEEEEEVLPDFFCFFWLFSVLLSLEVSPEVLESSEGESFCAKGEPLFHHVEGAS